MLIFLMLLISGLSTFTTAQRVVTCVFKYIHYKIRKSNTFDLFFLHFNRSVIVIPNCNLG